MPDSPFSGASSAPSLDDILFNKLKDPAYSLFAFFHFLDVKLAPELIDFWLAAQDVRNMFEPEHFRSASSINKYKKQDVLDMDSQRHATPSVLRAKLAEIVRMTREIKRRHAESQLLVCQTYIFDDAPLCINISDRMRAAIISRCPKNAETDEPVLGLFDDAMTECESLMTNNYLAMFLHQQEQHSLLRKTRSPPLPPPLPPTPSKRKSTPNPPSGPPPPL